MGKTFSENRIFRSVIDSIISCTEKIHQFNQEVKKCSFADKATYDDERSKLEAYRNKVINKAKTADIKTRSMQLSTTHLVYTLQQSKLEPYQDKN